MRATGRAAFVWLLLAGCAIRREDADPVETIITVRFPSLAAAIPVENIQLQIFAADGNAGKCAELLADLRNGSLPAAQFSKTNNICEYYRDAVKVPAQLGDVAILAVATLPSGDEAFSGCVQEVLGAGPTAALPITMSRSGRSDLVVSAGSCPSLEQLCSSEGCP